MVETHWFMALKEAHCFGADLNTCCIFFFMQLPECPRIAHIFQHLCKFLPGHSDLVIKFNEDERVNLLSFFFFFSKAWHTEAITKESTLRRK